MLCNSCNLKFVAAIRAKSLSRASRLASPRLSRTTSRAPTRDCQDNIQHVAANMEANRSKAHLAVASGMFATGGSLLGKLAGGADFSSLTSSLLVKGALLICMITSNTVGCSFFVKALNSSGSSLPVTVASTTTNYMCSALVGFLVFGESTSLAWWCGTSLVLLGLILICYVPEEKDASEKKLK